MTRGVGPGRGTPAVESASPSNRLTLLLLALLVGTGAGLGAVVFRYLIAWITRGLTSFADYSDKSHAPNAYVPSLGPYFVLLTPIVAGLLYGPLVYFFAREARGHGVPEVMLAVARQGGRIRPQVAVVKALASALCIGGGGSVGREGPIVQIGSALGSTLAQILHLDERRVRLLVSCGAAGGIAATFNAPLAGVFFAMEIILRQWATESFGMVVLSSVTASVIGRSLLGNVSFLQLPSFSVEHFVQYPLFAVLGILAGFLGVVFSRVLYGIEDACDAAWRGPEWARPAVGGVLLGGLLLGLPEMYGVGYPVLDKSVAGGYAIGFLLLLLVGKMVATSLSIGIGGSGGVFAPSLFIGATFGAAFGDVVHYVLPSLGGSPGAYALVGMGAVFAGSARAPITAVVILFELTGEYSIILPLMLAIVLATGISHWISADTIYTRKLLRRGIDIDEPAAAKLRRQPVAAFMGTPPDSVPADGNLKSIARRFSHTGELCVPVADADGRHVGILGVGDVMDAIASGEDTDVAKLMVGADPVAPDAPMGDVLRRLDRGDAAVAVVSGDQLVGWVRHRDILAGMTRPVP